MAIGAQPTLLIAGLGPIVAGLTALAAASLGPLGAAKAATPAADLQLG
jgi:hypothetical protein